MEQNPFARLEALARRLERVERTQNTGGGGATSLDGLSDVIISAPASGQGIVHNGSSFVNVDVATQVELDAHLNDTVDAHDASAISYAGGTGMSATDVEAALDELAAEKANTADILAPEAWISVTFAGSWANFSTYSVKYYKDRTGVVRLRGMAFLSPTPGAESTIFTLPSGYRPGQEMNIASIGNNGTTSLARIRITTGGAVSFVSGASSSWLSLDNIQFRAE